MSHLPRFLMLATVAMIAAARPGLALDTADGYVFVPNRGSADVAVIDTRTDRLVARAAGRPRAASGRDLGRRGQAGRQQHRR